MPVLQSSLQACLHSTWTPGLDTALRVVTAIGLLMVLLWSSSQRYYPGQRQFAWLHVAMLVWLAASGAEMMSQSPECRLTLTLGAWPAIMLVAPLWALFLRQYLRSDYAPLSLRWRLLLGVPALLVGLAAVTNDSHGLLYGPATAASSFAPLRMHYDHGPLFYLAAAGNYSCAVAAMTALWSAWSRAHSGLQREQLIGFGFVMAMPWAANLAYLVLGFQINGADPTPLSFGVAAVGFAVLMRSRELFKVVPLARRLLVDELPDPVFVLDRESRVMEANRAALALAGLSQGWEARVLAEWPVLGERLAHLLSQHGEEVMMRLSDPTRVFEVRRRPLGEPAHRIGWLLQLRDVTASQLAQERALAALEERSAQLERVRNERSELREQALRDPLTGLYNRRALIEVFDRTALRQVAVQRPMVLALMDADHFKQVNDAHGHGVGDEVLKALAGALAQWLRASDDLFRVGGEEFLVLMPGADAASAKERLDGLRERLARAPFATSAGALSLTVSIGVAEWPACGNSLDQLLQAADAALYSAKLQGRDRSVLAVFSNPHARFVASRG